MDYNTQRDRIILPEYGRTVQQMVEAALAEPDREERQCMAESIMAIMADMSPQNKNIPGFKQRLWDHLALMAGYRLDIDYPYDIPQPKPADAKLPRIPYPEHRIRYRHYGALLESFIRHLDEMPEGEERDELTLLVAARMRHSLADWNKDAMSNEKIADDLARYTDGRVNIDPDTLYIPDLPAEMPARAIGRNRIKRNRRFY